MLQVPEQHRRFKIILGSGMILFAFLIVLISASFITDRQMLLVGIVCVVSTLIALAGSLILIGRND